MSRRADFWSGGDLGELYDAVDPIATACAGSVRSFTRAFAKFARLRENAGSTPWTWSRQRRAMRVALSREMIRWKPNLSFLATVGSTQPLCRPVRHRVGHHERSMRWVT